MLAAAVVGLLFWRQPSQPVKPVEPHQLASSVPVVTNAESAASATLELSRRKALYATFQKHPFLAAHETGVFAWTSEDGKNPDVIRQLAHNELEFERMAEESSRIYRRQLVYHKDTVDAQIERSKLTGEPVREITLPGLDGQQVQFEVTGSDLNPSGQQGTLTGYVAGQPGSTVSFAFKGGREAFTILSPSDGLFLQGDPREPGELIVKSINPETYVAGVCGNP